MNILVLLKMVPDVVEELEIAPDGRSLDPDSIRPIANESDEHALEQALLLKERTGAQVTVIGLDADGMDEVLFTALAKGADRAVKIGELAAPGTRARAAATASVLTSTPGLLPADIILTGTQAIDDLDGLTAPLLAHHLALPCLDIVTQVAVDAGAGPARVIKEYPGGSHGEYEVRLPAVLGIQAAEKPPRYVPVAKVRAAMKEKTIEAVEAPAAQADVQLDIVRMAKPERAGRAEMLDGAPEAVSGKLVEILAARGLL